MTTLSHNLVKIRKPHKCWGCLREFSPPSSLFRWSVAGENTVWGGYSCVACDELMGILEDDGEGHPRGFVAREIAERSSGEKIESPEQLLLVAKAEKEEHRKFVQRADEYRKSRMEKYGK